MWDILFTFLATPLPPQNSNVPPDNGDNCRVTNVVNCDIKTKIKIDFQMTA